jgi:Ca2+/Na+ antiporter
MSNLNLTTDQLDVLKTLIHKLNNQQGLQSNLPQPNVQQPNTPPVDIALPQTTMSLFGYVIEKKYVYIIALLTVLIVVYLLWKWWKNKKTAEIDEEHEQMLKYQQHQQQQQQQYYIQQQKQYPPQSQHHSVQPVQTISNEPEKNIQQDKKNDVVQELEN